VLANGGTARPLPGTWSATSELLASELAPRFGEIELIELRYRVKTWNQLESCMADVVAALELAWRDGARECLLVGFSMGGAVSIGVAGHDAAAAVLGLAPWIPDRLPLDGLRGKRFDVIHGAWDRFLPGIPGVSPDNSRRGYERARAIGVSNFLVHHLEDLLADSQVVPAIDQVEFHPYLFQKELLNFCRGHAIQLEAWGPLMKGQIVTKKPLITLAKKYHRTPAQIALRWDLQHEVVTIPKSSKPERILENAQVFDFELSPEDMHLLDGLDEGLRLGPNPDHVTF